MKLIIVLLLILGLFITSAGSVLAEPKSKYTASVTTTADLDKFRAGDYVIIEAITNAPLWKQELRCYQGNDLVIVIGSGPFVAGRGDVLYHITSPVYEENPIGAECEVWAVELNRQERDIQSPLLFHLLPEGSPVPN